MEYIDTPEPGSFAAGLERKESEEEADDQMSEEELALMKEARAEYDSQKHGWAQEQDDCDHPEHDHYVCLYCGKELDVGEFIDRAMDAREDR